MPALIAPRGRRPAVVAIAVGVVVTVVLAAIVWRGTTTSFDTWVFERSASDFGPRKATERTWWLVFSEPWISLIVPAAVTIWAWFSRQRALAVFTVVAPLVALGVTELVAKPLVRRVLGPFILQGNTAYSGSRSFPSGHETGLVSWLVVVVVVVFRQTNSAWRRAATVGVAVLWAVAGGFGLTINHYHYATDTVGATGLTVAVVLTVALVIDRCARDPDRGAGGRHRLADRRVS